jgi:transcriptional regulator with XRE-family HTH domain
VAREESAAARGARRSRLLTTRLLEELTGARRAAGLSIREMARRLGCSHDLVRRFEAGARSAQTIELLATYAAVVGLRLAASLYPDGDPVRDAAHLRLLARFKRRLHALLRWRTEVVIPIAGDARSGDAVIEGDGWDVLVEAETYVDDVQLVERRAAAKQRDLGADRLILLIAATRHNREVLRLHAELRARFPIDTRACLRRLAAGEDPGGDCLVIL